MAKHELDNTQNDWNTASDMRRTAKFLRMLASTMIILTAAGAVVAAGVFVVVDESSDAIGFALLALFAALPSIGFWMFLSLYAMRSMLEANSVLDRILDHDEE